MMLSIAKRTVKRAAVVLFRAYVGRLPSPPFDAARVRKILVPAYAGIGNIVLYTPALAALRARFPSAEIVLAVGNNRSNEEVLGPALVDRVLEVPLRASLGRKLRDIVRIRRERFDLCVNAFFCYWPYQISLTAFARIPWRCGHVSSPGWIGPFDQLYNIPARMERDQYESERYLELAYALGVPRDSISPDPAIAVSDSARQRARALLERGGLREGAPFVVVHAGTSAVLSWKQWGVDRFEAVVLRLAERHPHAFVLVGAPDERDAQAPLVAGLEERLGARFLDLVGATDIATLAAVIAEADLLVGNDSGPMQIAVALGVPTVVPWGPSDLPRNAPRGPMHTVLFKHLPCAPCYHMPGDSSVHLCTLDRQCLGDITIDDVAGAAEVRLVQIGARSRREVAGPR
jgi:ADP-heptose:LPS heptosyltransferase